MKRDIFRVLSVATLTLVGLAGCAGAAPNSGGGSSAGAGDSLSTASTGLGTIIVDGEGMTTYVFDKDTANSGTSACTGSCAVRWPAVKTTRTTPDSSGITGTVGTIDAIGGGKQVTINGLPLYTYAGDGAVGDVTGQGFGGIWWTVDPAGKKITQTATNDRGY